MVGYIGVYVMTVLGDPIPVDESNNEEPEQTSEAGTCPECGGRGNPCGSTLETQYYNCEYCDNSFSEAK